MKGPLTRLFPTPSFFAAQSVGLDFSDATLRFIKLKETPHGIVPDQYAEVAVPEGCMQGGRIIDAQALTAFLSKVRSDHHLKYVRVAIPESQVYSFTLALDTAASEDIHGAIELVLEDNIPLKVVETIFDYHILSANEKSIVVQVMAIAESVSQAYFDVFSAAGFIPTSFELDGQAVARAVFPPKDTGAHMVVDFGANRTGITIVTNGTAVYTSSLDFGGKALLTSLSKELNISLEEAQKLKREYGLAAAGPQQNLFSILVGGVSILKDEINRRYIYWQDKKNQFGDFPPIETIYLCGGHSNLRGLADYLKVTLKLNVVHVNAWRNCLSFDEVIPRMPAETSLSYVTAIGLALADYLYD